MSAQMAGRASLLVAFGLLPVSQIFSQDLPPARNLEIAGDGADLSLSWLVFRASESSQGVDLNGDGDALDAVVHVHDLGLEQTTNLSLAVDPAETLRIRDRRWILFSADEASNGEDLNGDGDTVDGVIHVHDLAVGETTNLEISGSIEDLSGSRLVLDVREVEEGRDLNGDGDTGDSVLHTHDLGTGSTTNLELSGTLVSGSASEARFAFTSPEAGPGEDLNGDGDTGDTVFRVHDHATGGTLTVPLALTASGPLLPLHASGKWAPLPVSELLQGRDLNGDGDLNDNVLHLHDLESGTTANLEFALATSRPLALFGWLTFNSFESAQGMDLNGDGDTDDNVLHARNLESGATISLGESFLLWQSFLLEPANQFLIAIVERSTGEDLNGDGDVGDRVLHVVDPASGEFINKELAVLGGSLHQSGPFVWFEAREGHQGQDLNGDGDLDDSVLHLLDRRSAEVTNLRVAILSTPDPTSGFVRVPIFFTTRLHKVSMSVDESAQGVDLNGDGDTDDAVVHVHDPATGEMKNLGLAGAVTGVREQWILIQVEEWSQGEDLNGDGDTGDLVPHAHDLDFGVTSNAALAVNRSETRITGSWMVIQADEAGQSEDLNGDGDRNDRVLHVRDLGTGETVNLLAEAGRTHAPWLVLDSREDLRREDLNGDGDRNDVVLEVVDMTLLETVPSFVRGDCNADRFVNLSDGVSILSLLFAGQAPPCRAACEADGDGELNLTDVVFLLSGLFRGGGAPPQPFPVCAASLRASDIAVGCETPPDCR